MTTQTNIHRKMDAIEQARADIANLIGWFECELENDVEVTRATVSSLDQVRRNLIETLALFSGFDQGDIRRSLDEMRS